MTNAEKIRSMTDEELIKFLICYQRTTLGKCYDCGCDDYSCGQEFPICEDVRLWLRSEAHE